MSLLYSFRKSFVVKYIGLILCLVFFVLSAGFFLVFRYTREMLLDSAQKEAWMICRENVNLLDQTFFRYEKMTQGIVLELEKVPQEQWDKVLQDCLHALPELEVDIHFLGIVALPKEGDPKSDGYVAVATSDNKIRTWRGRKYEDKNWFASVVKRDDGAWIENREQIMDPYWLVAYACPVKQVQPDGTKKVIGVCTLAPNLDWLNKLVNDIKLRQNRFIVVSTLDGMHLAGQIKENVGKYYSEVNPSSLLFSPSVGSMDEIKHDLKTQETCSFILQRKSDKQYVHVFAQWIPRTSWSFSVAFPEKEMYAPIRKLQNFAAIISLCMLLFLAVISYRLIVNLSVPIQKLTHFAKEIGKGNFSEPAPNTPGQDEIGILTDTINQMRFSLVEHIERIREFTSVNERLASEMQIAKKIQMGLLPEIGTSCPVMKHFEVGAQMHSAKEVGGDLYDCLMLSPEKIVFAVGDVSGKGVPASLFMAVTQMLHRTLWKMENVSPQSIVSIMNQNLCSNNKGRLFVSFLCGVIDAEKQTMTYCNAGHDPFYILQDNGQVKSACQRNGIPLGLRDQAVYSQSECRLESNDTVVFYTDGITEAENSAHEFFGMKRFLDLLQHLAGRKLPAEKLVDEILHSLQEFAGTAEQSDDITCMTIRYRK